VRKITMKGLVKGQKGQALVAALILLVVGGLILTPLLGLMGTGIKSGQVFEQKVDEVYAADAGVEDALWYIRNDEGDNKPLIQELLGAGYDKYDYSSPYPYPYNLLVNDKDVVVNIANVWLPKDIATPSKQQAQQIIEGGNLTIIGYPSSNTSTYVIKIVYNWGSSATTLKVKTIGIWISPGFEYDGGCSLAGYSSQNVSPYKGGSAVVWTFASQPTLASFAPSCTTSCTNPLVKTFTFKYTGPQGQIPELVSSWIDTTGVTGITYSWDDTIRLYKIVSQAGAVQVEAYGAQTKFRKLKSTISSDYAVAGNRLSAATATSGSDRYARDRLYADSSSPITRIPLQSVPPSGIVPAGYIPEEATIDKVYLYWSGWIDPYYWYKSGSSYYWAQIPDLRYSQRTKAQLIANSQVNMGKFKVGDTSAQTVTANISGVHSGVPDIQIISTSDSGSDSWVYSCFKDVTNLAVSGNITVQQYIENAMKTAGSGQVDFTVGHADEVRGQIRASPYQNYNFTLYNTSLKTSYPLATPAHKRPDDENDDYVSRYQWSYAGWSLIIFYRSPGLVQRQLYLYDDFRYVGAGGYPDTETFDISGFLAPPVISENDKSHLTYFVGEGDAHYYNDRIKVNGASLYDYEDEDPNPENNVFNSQSNALPTYGTDGVDVDTFVLPDGCIMPYATSAQIQLITQRGYNYIAEIYTSVYLVLSFRSELTTGGVITNYQIKIS
jgi:hypothetical protein